MSLSCPQTVLTSHITLIPRTESLAFVGGAQPSAVPEAVSLPVPADALTKASLPASLWHAASKYI